MDIANGFLRYMDNSGDNRSPGLVTGFNLSAANTDNDKGTLNGATLLPLAETRPPCEPES
jgi:hypothetical protein